MAKPKTKREVKATPAIDYLSLANKLRNEFYIQSNGIAFGFVSKNGEIISYRNEACYYLLLEHKHVPPVRYFVDFVMSCLGERDMNRAVTLEFIHFIINDSVFAENFVTKDAQEVIDKGAILHAHNNIRHILGGLMALRFIYEKPTRVTIWKKICEYTNPHIALILCHFFFFHQKGDTFGYSIPGGHDFISNSTFGSKKFQNFLANKVTPHLPTLASGDINYDGMDTIWGDAGYMSWPAKHNEDTGWGNTSTYPLSKFKEHILSAIVANGVEDVDASG